MLNGLKMFSALFAALLLTSCATIQNTPRQVVWQIGQADENSNEFDTDPHDDPATVDFTLGAPASHFPNGLGTDIGKQRSMINIHWSSAVPEGSRLLVHWSPGGSGSAEQFRVAIQDVACGESPVRTGTMPYRWRSDYFPLPPVGTGDHVVSLIHLKGDGLHIDYVALVTN